MPSQPDKAKALRHLHERPCPFIIPNPFDTGGARVLEHIGLEALAWGSAGYAVPRGRRDGAVGFAQMLAVAACALSLAVTTGNCAAPRLPSDLARAASDYDRAQSSGDRAAFERLLAPDYTLVNSAAQVETRAQFIAESTAPGFALKPFTVEDPIVKLWPGGAVLAGAVFLDGVSDRTAFKGRIRFADIWRKRNGRWQLVFTGVTRIPKP